MPKKILLIDDAPYILKIIANRLKVNNYEVITAEDGEDGLKKVLGEKPDLIIADLLMPKMDGRAFVKEVRKNEEVKNIPIVMFSAKDAAPELLRKQEINGFLPKPCTPEELLNTVKEILKEE